jgi:hypothetical protein
MMRSVLAAAGVAAATVFGSMFLSVVPAKALANLAYCLQRGESTECDYTTYEQCQASASGIGADCISNPDPRAVSSSAPALPGRRASRRH